MKHKQFFNWLKLGGLKKNMVLANNKREHFNTINNKKSLNKTKNKYKQPKLTEIPHKSVNSPQLNLYIVLNVEP